MPDSIYVTLLLFFISERDWVDSSSSKSDGLMRDESREEIVVCD